MYKTLKGLKVNLDHPLTNLTVGKEYWIDSTMKFPDDKGQWHDAECFDWQPRGGKESLPYIHQEPDHIEDIFHKETADRFNEGKPQLSYLLSAPSAIAGLAETFAYGAIKYSRDNWKKGLDRNDLVDSLLRHLTKAENGEVLDDESGLPHLDHVLWNALVLADQYNGKRK